MTYNIEEKDFVKVISESQGDRFGKIYQVHSVKSSNCFLTNGKNTFMISYNQVKKVDLIDVLNIINGVK